MVQNMAHDYAYLRKVALCGLAAVLGLGGCATTYYYKAPTRQEIAQFYEKLRIETLQDILTNQMPNLEETILNLAEENQVIMLGEVHDIVAEDFFVGDLLRKLKERGYHHLAIEWDEGDQPVVDKFLSGQIDEEKLPAYFRDNKLYILTKARDAGIKIHCIEPYQRENEKNRDELMYENLEKKVFSTEPEAKIVVFIGAWHTLKNDDNKKCITTRELLCGYPLGYYLSKVKNKKTASIILSRRFGTKTIELNRNFPQTTRGIILGKDADLIANPPLEYLEYEFRKN